MKPTDMTPVEFEEWLFDNNLSIEDIYTSTENLTEEFNTNKSTFAAIYDVLFYYCDKRFGKPLDSRKVAIRLANSCFSNSWATYYTPYIAKMLRKVRHISIEHNNLFNKFKKNRNFDEQTNEEFYLVLDKELHDEIKLRRYLGD